MPKREAPVDDESRKKRKSQAGTAITPNTARSSIDNDAKQDRTAAARFMAISELRRYLFEFLDEPSLARMARVEKGLTYDVAQVLYRTVTLHHLRFKMSRSSARRRIYCDAVRWVIYNKLCDNTDSLRLAFEKFDATTVGQSSPRPKGSHLLVLIKIAREKCPYTRGIEQNHGGPLQGGLRVIFDPAGRSGAFVGQHLYFYDNGTLRQERPRLYPALSGFAESPTSISLVSSQTDEHDDLRSLQLPGKVEYLESYGQGATALFLAKVLQKLRNDGDDLSQLRTLLGHLSISQLDFQQNLPPGCEPCHPLLPAADFPALVMSLAETLPLLQELSIGLLYTTTCTSALLGSALHQLHPRYARLRIGIHFDVPCLEVPWLAVALLAYLQDPEKNRGLSVRLSGRYSPMSVRLHKEVQHFAQEMVLLMAADRLLFYDLCRDAFESPDRIFTGNVDIVKREFERMYNEKHRDCSGDSHNHLD